MDVNEGENVCESQTKCGNFDNRQLFTSNQKFMTTYFHDPTKITAPWAISSFFLFPVHAYSHAYTNTHTQKVLYELEIRKYKIMPNKERSSRWAKWPRKSLPHYIKIIIIIIKNLFRPTQSSLIAVYDNELNMHEHQGNFVSLHNAKPPVNNKTINNKTFVSVIYANPILI